MLSGLLPESMSEAVSIRGASRLSTWPTLLVVDPDGQMARTIVCFFEKRGFHVAAATSFAEMKDYFHRRRNWTLVVADYHLPDATGAELAQWVRDEGGDSPVLLMSGSPHSATLCAGNDYLSKPFPIEKLEAYVNSVRRCAVGAE
jgi:DNA-binding response OmpR family regulator